MSYKKLSKTKPLSGELETITAMDFRRQPGEIIASIELGKTFILTKSGREVALLTALPGQTLTISVDRHGKQTYKL